MRLLPNRFLSHRCSTRRLFHHNASRRANMSRSYLVIQPTANIDTTISLVERLQPHDTPHAFWTLPAPGPSTVTNLNEANEATEACLSHSAQLESFIADHEGVLLATDVPNHPLLARLERMTTKPVLSTFEASVNAAALLAGTTDDNGFVAVIPGASWTDWRAVHEAAASLLSRKASERLVPLPTTAPASLSEWIVERVPRDARSLTVCSAMGTDIEEQALQIQNQIAEKGIDYRVTLLDGVKVGARILMALVESKDE